MRLVTSIKEMKSLARETRSRGKTLGLVPTMGALHSGHVSLVLQAKRQCDVVAVSIFVNPTQFGPSEDYDQYPRELDRDIDLLGSYNVDFVFAPASGEMYSEGFQTFIDPGPLAQQFEGASRPGHFRGVATVVVKLFNILSPDMAYFGQKDFQQAVVIRRLVEDLNLNVQMVFCPIVREKDGLAISSRNVFLNQRQRKSALALSRSLRRAEELAGAGQADARQVLSEMNRILKADPEVKVDYTAIVNPTYFEPVQRITAGTSALVAAHVGPVRLIDNTIFGPPESSPEDRLHMAFAAPAVADTGTRIPGIDVECVTRKIDGCRDCAAISTILLPPREYMAKYVKRDYPNLNDVRVAVIGRHASTRPDNSYYRNDGRPNRFVNGLYDLLGIKDFATFKKRFILTDAIRCHATGPRTPERAMRNCARHLRNELNLFPNLNTLVVLGEDAYEGVQRFLLGRNTAEVPPFAGTLGSQGWAEDSLNILALGNREFRIIYCHHPSLGYQRSPSISSLLQ